MSHWMDGWEFGLCRCPIFVAETLKVDLEEEVCQSFVTTPRKHRRSSHLAGHQARFTKTHYTLAIFWRQPKFRVGLANKENPLVSRNLVQLEESPENTEKRDPIHFVGVQMKPFGWDCLSEQRLARTQEFEKRQPQETNKYSCKKESWKRCKTRRVWKKPFWPNKKMEEGRPIHA